MSANANNVYATGRRAERARRHIHLTFGGCLKGELLKLWSLKSTTILLLLTVGFMVGMTALVAWTLKLIASTDLNTGKSLSEPKPVAAVDVWSSISSSASVTALVIGIFGVMAITSEYTTSAVQSSLVANPRRGLFYVSKSVAVALFALVGGLIGVAGSYLILMLMFNGIEITAFSGDEWRIVPVTLVGIPVVTAVVALLAQGLGGLTRSTVGGIVAVVLLFMVLSTALSVISMATSSIDWLKWVGSLSSLTPDNVISTFLAAGQSSGVEVEVQTSAQQTYWTPNWWQAGLVILGWAAAAWTAGLAVTRRVDIA